MKKLITIIIFLLLINLVSANIIITEVMYNPSSDQGTDTLLEWIELYNDESIEDLSTFFLDGKRLSGTIDKNEFIIIARNLNGFESYYGNNDTIWNNLDGDFKVFQASISFSNTNDLINLSNQNYSEILSYSDTWGGDGNGFTLQKIDVNQGNNRENWNESSIYGGTPGRFYGSGSQNNDNQVKVMLEVDGSLKILNISLTDDLSDPGFQIFPEPNNNKSIELLVYVNASSVIAEFRGEQYELTPGNPYKTSFSLNYFDPPGNYTINIIAIDTNNETVNKLITFEYLGLLSSELSVKEINFGKVNKNSYTSELEVSVINQGNIVMDLELTSSDLKNGNQIILADNIEVFGSIWFALSKTPTLLNTSIVPELNSKKDLNFRVKVPTVARGNYEGSILIIGLEK